MPRRPGPPPAAQADAALAASTPRGPAYRIETQRLVIRCWQPADAPALDEAINESVGHLQRWVPWAADEPLPLDERLDWIREMRAELDLGKDYRYGVFDRAEARVFGGVGLHPRVGPRAIEVGYWVRAGSVGQGIAKEAASAMVRIAFEVHGVERLDLKCEPGNLPSAGVARRLGFFHEATLRRAAPGGDDGQLVDLMLWTMVPEEYRASALARMPVRAWDALGRPLL